MRRIQTLLCCLTVSTLFAGARVDAGVIFSDNFDSGASPSWGNEVGSWAAAGGVYSAGSPGNAPNAHSSLPYVLGDFVVDVDVNQVQDGGIWLRSTEAPGTSIGIRGILLVTGGSGGAGTGLYWHIVTDPNNYGASVGAVSGLFTPGVSDAHIRIVVQGNTYSAYVNGSSVPATSITTGAFASGNVALYDFSQAQTFDNFVLSTASAVPEPSTVVLLVSGAVVFGVPTLRRRTRASVRS